MAFEIEIEFKNLITKTEFDQLLKAYPFPINSVKQTNYYFETEQFQCKENGAALRIRKKNDQFVLTLKEPDPLGLLETHDILTVEEAASWLYGKPVGKEHTKSQLSKLGIQVEQLKYFGYLITERREIEYKNTLLVLDYSKYQGKEDFELELETKDRDYGEQIFMDILAEQQIPSRPTPSKTERFFLASGQQRS